MTADDSPSISPLTPTRLSQAAGISLPYASQILSGSRPVRRPLAIKVWRATGTKLGELKDATDAEILVLEKFERRADGASEAQP